MSEIISPSGEVLAKAQTDGDDLVIAAIDLDEITVARKKWDLLADRGPDQYRLLAE